MTRSIRDLIIEYFLEHPGQDIEHGPVVDWVSDEYKKQTGQWPRDPWRTIRKLHQEGFLIKVAKGIYKYDSDYVHETRLYDFSIQVKEEVLARDNYCCVVCGRGLRDGIELVVDHIKPKDRGGTNDPDNGQTLCTEHNLLKKNYSQTEAGKRYFIKIYEKAVESNDERMMNFCRAVFDVYDQHRVDTHIERPDL